MQTLASPVFRAILANAAAPAAAVHLLEVFAANAQSLRHLEVVSDATWPHEYRTAAANLGYRWVVYLCGVNWSAVV